MSTTSHSATATKMITMTSTTTTRRAEAAVATAKTTQNLCQFLCIIAACIVCYYNSAQCGLVFDDISAVRDNKDLRPSTPWRKVFLNDFWGTPMRKEHSHKSYRPLTVLTFRLNYLLHALEPSGYHIVNVLLHIFVCLLWRRVSRLLLLQSADVQRETVATHDFANSCSFVATLLFAVHPIHTEAVTGVVGRAELLSSIFYLLAFLVYASAVTTTPPSSSVQRLTLRRTRWWTLWLGFTACLLASMLSKEQGITIAGICAAYELFIVQQLRPFDLWLYILKFFEDKKSVASPRNVKISPTRSETSTATPSSHIFNRTLIKRLSFLIFITLALLIGRVYVMGSQLPIFTRFDNPASVAETPIRQLTFSYLIYLNSWLLLFPNDLCCDWTMGTIPLIEGFTDLRNIATVLTFGAFAALVAKACTTNDQYRSQSRVLLMCLAWLVLPFVPASNLFFPVGFVVAERILYMPSMGFCLLVAYGYKLLQQHFEKQNLFKNLLKTFLIFLLLTHAYKTHQRNKDWRTEYTLFMSGLHVNERNAKLFNNVGHSLENELRFHEALVYFKEASKIQPDDIGAHINVGRTYNNLKMFAEAEAAYLKAKALFPKIKPGESYQARIAPNHLNVFINLANLISKNQTRLEEADFLYRQAISMRADYVQAYINRGDILMKLNRTAEAQQVYEKALLYDSENADIYYNLGVVLMGQGKSTQAHVYFNKAIEIQPTHEQALLSSAVLLQEMGGAEARSLSRERLYKVLDKDVDKEKVYFNLGMLAMDESNYTEAETFFKRAIHLRGNFSSALFNLALLLADVNRPLDAIPFLNQLMQYHPSHIKGLILLGDIYINHIKDLDAAETYYRIILKYEPHNVEGVHNLCVVFVERKQLAKAFSCFKYAHFLAPNEDYILRHLKIVQKRLKKLEQLPANSAEIQEAFAGFDPQNDEFSMHQKPETLAANPMGTKGKGKVKKQQQQQTMS